MEYVTSYKLSVSDVRVSQKGSNGDGKIFVNVSVRYEGTKC